MRATAQTIHGSEVFGYPIEDSFGCHMYADDHIDPVQIKPDTLQYLILGDRYDADDIEGLVLKAEAYDKLTAEDSEEMHKREMKWLNYAVGLVIVLAVINEVSNYFN